MVGLDGSSCAGTTAQTLGISVIDDDIPCSQPSLYLIVSLMCRMRNELSCLLIMALRGQRESMATPRRATCISIGILALLLLLSDDSL